MRRDDRAVSNLVGAIIVFAILSIAILYVNAFYVPRQGTSREVEARDAAESALLDLATTVSAADGAAVLHDLPLRGPASAPPLLSGIVMSPVAAPGRLAFEPSATNVTISARQAAPAGGVPAGDPMREDLGGGLMRVYLLGNATRGVGIGTLELSLGGAYLEPATYQLAAGAVIVDRGASSSLISAPALQLGAGRSGLLDTTTVSWRVPVLSGQASEVAGATAAQVSLAPGPLARAGGGQAVRDVTITVETSALWAWRTALEQTVGARGTVTVTPGPDPDSGIVTAVILPPAGTPASADAVQLNLESIRYAVDFSGRNGG